MRRLRSNLIPESIRWAAALESLEMRRLLSASSLDNTFDGDGTVVGDFEDFEIGLAIEVQPWDEKILVVNSGGGAAAPWLVRYNPDGTLNGSVDLSLHGFFDAVDVALAPGNKIVVLGNSLTNNDDLIVARFDSSLTLDNSFGTGGVWSENLGFDSLVARQDLAGAIGVRTDASVLIGATSTGVSVGGEFAVVQLTSSGTLDSGFGDSGITFIPLTTSAAQLFNMVLHSDGTALLVGHTMGTTEDYAMARVDQSGDLDPLFGTGGVVIGPDSGNTDTLSGAVITPGGDILAIGAHGVAGVLLRFDSTGALDNDFAGLSDPRVELLGAEDGAFSIMRDSNGKLLITGASLSGGFSLSRYDASGSLDTSFDGDGNVNTPIGAISVGFAMTFDPHGRILVAGFTDPDGSFTNLDLAVVRYGDAPVNNTVIVESDVDGNLIITGTTGAESIVITRNTAGTNVEVGGTPAGSFSNINAIIIKLGDGNDQVNVASSLTTPLFIDAGAGDDTIKGGSGNDILLGGPGNDRVMGAGGRDLMIGGDGADRMLGDNDDDIMIAGTTTHDADDTALTNILAEWTSSRDYQTRVANIRGIGSGPRNNGSSFLADANVFDDGVVDSLSGNAGTDWFLFNEGHDVVTDLHRNEFGEDLG